MDPHFNEYLAAIAGMHDIYGEAPDDTPTEFHEVSTAIDVVVVAKGDAPQAGCAHWDCEPSDEFIGSGTWI
jgi:hypothetical protein